MKTDQEWAYEALREFKAVDPTVRMAIEISVARVVRHVRREINLEAADAIESLEAAREALK